MKRKILLSLLTLLSVCGLAEAVELPWSAWGGFSGDGSSAYKQDELLVRFVDPQPGRQLQNGLVIAGPWSRRTIRTLVSDSIVTGAKVEKEYDNIAPGLAAVKLPGDADLLDAFIQFNLAANVVYAEPNYKYRLFRVPNDPDFPKMWALDNTGQTGGTADADVDAPEAWDVQTGDRELVVAVIDTGIDYAHPDLRANMWVNTAEKNGAAGVDDDGNGYVDDIYGYDFAGARAKVPNDGDGDPCDTYFHGTHIAGIVGAVGNNNVGVTGVCWNVKLMALKTWADDFLPTALTSETIEAIGYAVDNGAKIISASWGGPDFSQSLYDAIKNAGDAGLLFVAAAGNDGKDNDAFPVYPASFDLANIISVMATDHDDKRSTFSNYGASSVDLAAPGTDILSTLPTKQLLPMIVFGVTTSYDRLSGTSQAAPFVAGACAIVWSEYPTLPNRLVKGLLLKTVDPVLGSPRVCVSGGRLNLHKALTLIPSGRAGKVLNTKDDPKDPANLYPTIQQAIDAASDGDVLIAEAGTLFIEAIDFKGKAITLRSGNISDPNDPNISPEDTRLLGLLAEGPVVTFANGEGPDTVLQGFNISWGNADFGGGIRCDSASPSISDCIITNNFAKYYGAGIDCYGASPTITNCTITENQTLGSTGIGGGVNCELSSPVISNCLISNNFADNVGGGIACYYANPTILNCVLANNSAIYQAGGIHLEYSSPAITNCTIVVDDPNASKDGGIFAHGDSFPVITNCILWGNGDDLYNCSATYSNIEDKDRGVGNIHVKPTFVTGPLGDYYLSQKAAGQLVDSAGIDLGNPDTDPALKIDTYTTRTDGVADGGRIDIGAHYPALPPLLVRLDIGIVEAGRPVDPNLANGRVEPASGLYRQYEVVLLKAYPNAGYRVKAWTGTNNDSIKDPNNTITLTADATVTVEFEKVPVYQLRTEVIGGRGSIAPYHRRGQSYPDGTVVRLIATADPTYIVDRWAGTDDDRSWAATNTVTMNSDKEVTVSFRRPKSLHVPGQYPTIAQAVEAAHTHGDTIIVSPGTYSGAIDFGGKAITIASERPDDPCCVAATVIRIFGTPAFIFQSGEGHDSVVDGFTIQGPGAAFSVLAPNTGGTGAVGGNAFGGAISALNGSSPTLANLVIKDVFAVGQNGENASFVFDPPGAPPDPLDPLDPVGQLPDPPVPDPNDPNHWAPADPNRPPQPDPDDPNAIADASADGFDGQDGEPGLPGEPGANGADGAPGFPGGNGGAAYGGAMYFDANSAPIILNCTIMNCQAIGGNGGFGGAGGDGQDGQDGQPGQDGQQGQNGGEPLGDGEQGAAGNGGAGGDGGPGGNGGRGGDGGKGGDGGEALGGAIYFGPNCRPTIRFCKILNCSTQQGLGNYGGAGGNGGNGGVGAEPGEGADGGDGEPDGQDGADGGDGPGGNGGDGGTGGDMGINGTRSWAGAIYFGENCRIDMADTIISYNATKTIVPFYTYSGGDGGDGGTGGDGEGAAPGGTGGTGGDGGAGGPPLDPGADVNDPNISRPGIGGIGGPGGAGGEAGSDGADGAVRTSYTTGYGGAHFYDVNSFAELRNCIISYNASRQYDGTGLDGGGEYYQTNSTAILDRCDIVGNKAGISGRGGGQYFNWSIAAEIRDCNYVNNSSGMDGGGFFCLSDSSFAIDRSNFVGNTALGYYGAGGAIYGGGVWDWNTATWHNGNTITVNDSYFGANDAAFGGALYWHGEEAEVSIANSTVSGNTAEHGGGMYWVSGDVKITDSSIMGNKARTRWFMADDVLYQQYFYYTYYLGFLKLYGGGGGMFCWSSDAQIENCFVTGNSSAGSGGGVYFGGDPSLPTLKNCVVKGNSAVLDGGGIVSYWNATPAISNCTIVYNHARDPQDAKHGRGGGLACSYQSRTTLIDSILWGNTATTGNQIAIGSESKPTLIDRPASLTVSYCDIQGGKSREAIFVEPGRTLNWRAGNINADPLFVGSNYALSQIAAGQTANSPCVDAGSTSAAALGLDQLSTRTDGQGDSGRVDLGFHYSIASGKYRLTVKVIGGEHGTVKPLGGLYERFTVVRLQATVDPGYQVRWTGTDDDSSHALRNAVTMDSNKTVTVEFAKHVGQTVTVPGNYPTIQEAVNNARDGDTVVVDPGTYFGGFEGVSLLVSKAVTIQSRNPDDPCSVAATIIDGYLGTNTWPNIGVIFTSNTDARTVLNGFTIQNCGGQWANGADGERDSPVFNPDGFDGVPGQGAAILIDKGAGPIIKNCILRNNLVRGGDGGDGEDAEGPDPILNAGRGGWAGWAHGGAIYCGPNSTPRFINCVIENNVARGGDGGDGGDGGAAGQGYANYGGNWSRSQTYDYDPYSGLVTYVPGNLWEFWDWDFAATYGPAFDEPNLTSYYRDYSYYSALGGGAFCDIRSNVAFVSCRIRGNRTYGGLSGVGGVLPSGRNLEPLVAFEMPTYGAGVYCAAESTVSFTGCTFEDNVASGVLAGVDPNHRLDPYVGYGGGVCSQKSAAVVFVDCNFVGNEADSGGGLYLDTTNVTVVDSNIASNRALRGGGFLGVNSLANITSTRIANNRATTDANDPNNQDILANGAGLYCWLGGLNVRDCNVAGNIADFSGGGAYLRDVNTASFTNNLIINNGAGRDGGGISANWFTTSLIANCTIAGNSTIDRFGDPNDTGFGGGLFCGYESQCAVIDSIFWNNYALKGNAAAVGSDFKFDTRPSRLAISYSTVKDGRSGLWVDSRSRLDWGPGNIDKDPLFTSGPLDDYYLSHTEAGQGRTSPAVDAGSDYTSNVGLVDYTTRTDEMADLGRVDMGYHHPIRQPCRLCDLVLDGMINFRDFAKLADAWLEQGCSKQDSWCQGADLTSDTRVDFRDVLYLADCWLVQDTEPPTPNPSRWETEPYLSSGSSISMTAETAVDAWGWQVEYYFDCLDGGGGNDSGWQKSPTYTDGGLTTGVLYGYRVKARDGVGNETEWSVTRYAGIDTTPPAPAPYIESIVSTSPTSVTMIATTAYDDSDVEYYFENVSGNGHDSGWQPDPNYTDVGLDPNTEYSYRVRARDRSSNLNTTPWSDTVVIRTLVAPDLIPPTPDPMQWDPTVDPNGFDGTPREEYGGNGTFDYYAVMTAVVAVDAGGGPVEYYFECTTERGFSSGWIATPTYRVLLGRSGQGHRFRVRARDQFNNVTAWSPEDVAD